MSYLNPFYNNVDRKVEKTVKARMVAYSTKDRGGNDNYVNWAYAKTAYAIVTTYKVDNTGYVDLQNPLLTMGTQRPGIKSPGQQQDEAYLNFPSSINASTSLYSLSEGHRYLPSQMVLESVSLTNEGRLGSVQKITVKFTVFNLSELQKAEERILRTGLGIQVSYGWSVKLSSYADAGKFVGITHNFDWSMNEDGTFSCTVEATGQGFFGLGVPINASITPPEDRLTEDLAGLKLDTFNLVTTIDEEVARLNKENSSNTPGTNAIFESPFFPFGIGMCVISLDSKGSFKDLNNTGNQAQVKVQPENIPTYYITLSDIVHFINYSIFKQEPKMKDRMRYAIWKNKVGSPGTYDPNFVSCVPNEVLFSDIEPYGMSTYGDIHYQIGFTDIRKDSAVSGQTNLARIWVSTDTIKSAFDDVVKDEGSTQPANKRITQFFDKLFQRIAYASGDLYQLAIRLEELEDDRQMTLLYIYDKNWNDPGSTITPLLFDRGDKRSVLRDMQISAKLPDKSATVAYVGGRSKVTDDPAISVDDGSTIYITNREVDMANEIATKVRDAKYYMGQLGFSDTLSDQLYASLKQLKTVPSILGQDASWIRNQIYPVSLELTLDGINGFGFGNTVAVDYLPNRYKDSLHFIVTNITHQIGGGDWTTTLTTQARVVASKAKIQYVGASSTDSRTVGVGLPPGV